MQREDWTARLGIPYVNRRVVGAAEQARAIRAEGKRATCCDASFAGTPQFVAVANIPEAHGRLFSENCHSAAVGGEGEHIDVSAIPRAQDRAGPAIPHMD